MNGIFPTIISQGFSPEKFWSKFDIFLKDHENSKIRKDLKKYILEEIFNSLDSFRMCFDHFSISKSRKRRIKFKYSFCSSR